MRPGGLLRIARLAVRAGAKVGFAGAARREIDSMGVRPAIRRDRPEDGARVTPTRVGLARPRGRRVEVDKDFQPTTGVDGNGTSSAGNAETVPEVGADERVIADVRRRVQQANRVRACAASRRSRMRSHRPSSSATRSFAASKSQTLEAHDDVKDIVPLGCRCSAPYWSCCPIAKTVLIVMVTIRAADVRAALSPANTQGIKKCRSRDP